MITGKECYSCLLNQALNTTKILNLDREKTDVVMERVKDILKHCSSTIKPPVLGRDIYGIISGISGIKDPFRNIKEKCTRQALDLYPCLKQTVEGSSDRIKTAVKAAVAGNIIDFGTPHGFDLEKDVQEVLSKEFEINHLEEFRSRLNHASNVLYLADNAGETVFDRVLIEEINVPVTYAVKSEPIINDATLQDLEKTGIEELAAVIATGSGIPGTLLSACSETFCNEFKKADLIISKGQGNYECLSDEAFPIFFLLKAKCNVVARDIGVPTGSIVLLKSPHYSF